MDELIDRLMRDILLAVTHNEENNWSSADRDLWCIDKIVQTARLSKATKKYSLSRSCFNESDLSDICNYILECTSSDDVATRILSVYAFIVVKLCSELTDCEKMYLCLFDVFQNIKSIVSEAMSNGWWSESGFTKCTALLNVTINEFLIPTIRTQRQSTDDDDDDGDDRSPCRRNKDMCDCISIRNALTEMTTTVIARLASSSLSSSSKGDKNVAFVKADRTIETVYGDAFRVMFQSND